jgi:DNA-binding NtrC family response regulator
VYKCIQVTGAYAGDMENEQTVLVIDDERVIADTLAAILRHNGFKALAVYSGEDAIEAAQKISPSYAVVSDILLGGMSGIDVAIEIRKRCPECAVILFSGALAASDLLDKARAQGHEFEILAKPFDPDTLIDKLRAA